ncbi:MAG: UDP-N-acetylmuramoyl-L-alanine--D-glutamate ligase, partial [Chloroflexi bacterium]|nr:UDP-N-acetylmuramoyl-L-alanine--D-glutamate ligase [Chloroflexota bacterium]
GGRDKDLPWEAFAALVTKRVDHIIIFGEAADKVQHAVDTARSGKNYCSVHRCLDLQTAVVVAAQIVEPGDVVLFSPGGTSFDQFDNFADRGEWYRKWVNQLKS